MFTAANLFDLTPYFAALGALAFSFYIIPYLLDPYEYRRRFPGPRLAGFTNWWMSNVIRTGNHSEVVHKLHQKYGTFVRLGPNHINIADPDALEAVYGHGSGLLKAEFYKIFVGGGNPDMFSTSDKADHSIKRKRLANIFSPQNVLAFEPRVRSHIQQLCAQWDMRCKEAARGVSGFNWTANNNRAVINVCSQFSYLAFDIIGDLALGSPFGLVQAQKDSSLAIESVDELGRPQIGTMEVPIIEINANNGMIAMSVGIFPSWTHSFLLLLPWNLSRIFDDWKFFKLTKASVDARLKRGPREDSEDGKRSIDLIDRLLEVRNEDGTPLTTDELYAEALLLLAAGSDTTSNTLGSLCYYLAIHPEVQHKLQIELDRHVPYNASDEMGDNAGVVTPPPEAVVKYDEIKNLPYLNACVKEGLRVHSTIGTGLPRVVPPGRTVTIAGQTFKPGSVVSVPPYTTNRSSVWGNDAAEFRPERWLEDNAGSMNKYFVPFSVGPRACIGRNLAYMDLMMIIATLFRRYQIEALPTTKLTTHETLVREAAHWSRALAGSEVPVRLFCSSIVVPDTDLPGLYFPISYVPGLTFLSLSVASVLIAAECGSTPQPSSLGVSTIQLRVVGTPSASATTCLWEMRTLGWLAGCALLQSANVNAAIGTGPHWPGFKGLQYMFIFGDSYSTVSWAPTTAPNPTPANPIGVQWPGVTSVGSLQPNWVGYMTNGFNQSNLMALDYAIAGNNITGYTSQVQTEFLPTAGQKPTGVPWTADNSIFVSWIGINDLASATVPIESTISQIMQQQQNLYTLGARNFIFINVPPWDRAPLGSTNTGLKERILTWNAQLATSALAFSNQNTDASTLVWSSWDTLNTLLNDPAHYNLTSPNTIGGDIWKDDLHPTSAVHYRFANDLAGWLVSLPAGSSQPTTTSGGGGVATVTVGVGATVTVWVPPGSSKATATVLPSPQSGSSSSSW